MRINGTWHTCDDGVVRPVIYGQIRTAAGTWKSAWFLVDTGADRTVFCADDLARLEFSADKPLAGLGGVGGLVESVSLGTEIRLPCDDGTKALFRGEYAAFTSPASMDMSVLGRDIMDLLALVVDRPGDTICLVGQVHRYRIETR